MQRRFVTVNDKMQQGYQYELVARAGQDFDPNFEPDLTPKEMLALGDMAEPGPASTSRLFAAKTLATLKAEQAALPWPQRTWYRNVRRGAIAAAWLVGLALSASLGYYAANRLAPRGNTGMIRELPVIENLDTYSDVSDIKFLRELKEHPVFDEDKPNPPN